MTFNSSLYKLADWRIALPINSDGLPLGTAAIVNDLSNFESPGYFYNAADGGMVFAAEVAGAKSSGSQYCRSELREMDGSKGAAWSLTDGGTMTATLKVTETPTFFDGTPGTMVIGQVHGQDAELVRVYYQGGTVFFANDKSGDDNTPNRFYLANAKGEQPNVAFGEVFSYKVHVEGNQLTVEAYCDGDVYTSVTTINSIWNNDSFYFKAGAYLGVNETSGTGRGSATFYGLDYDHDPDAGLAGLVDPSYHPTEDMTLTGTDSADLRNGGIANDVISGLAGDDILNGNAGDDQIFGGDGNDRIDGGFGKDILTGGLGNDHYYVDTAGDVVVEEDPLGGIDTVTSSVSYTLSANVENLRLLGGDNLNATGNDGNNWLYGNRGNNVLDGAGGNDKMVGGEGDDTYIFSTTVDRAYELADGGHDTVISYVNLLLKDNLEDLDLVGTAVVGKGNALDNVITGSAGDNRLYGLDGNDTLIDGSGGYDKMYGGLGDDTYYVNNSRDVLVEYSGQGNDIVWASVDFTLNANVETLNLTGTAVRGTGNASDNTIRGNAMGNVINGGLGNDTLYGGAGGDAFLFNTVIAGGNNVDQLADFRCLEDQIYLSHSVFKGLGLGVLQKANFALGTEALTADQHIIYDKAHGDVYYDADGSGAGEQVLFAHIRPNAGLYYPDFEIL